MRRSALAAALLAALPLALAGCTDERPAAPSPTSDVPATAEVGLDPCPATGSLAAGGLPDLTFPCLQPGSELAVGAAPGIPAVLNLWAPWCGPCREELPLFEQLHAQGGEQVQTVGLVERDTVRSSLAFAAERNLTFPSALDETGRLMTEEGLNGLPATFFLRADGSIAHRQIGPITSYDQLLDLIDQHLGVQVGR